MAEMYLVLIGLETIEDGPRISVFVHEPEEIISFVNKTTLVLMSAHDNLDEASRAAEKLAEEIEDASSEPPTLHTVDLGGLCLVWLRRSEVEIAGVPQFFVKQLQNGLFETFEPGQQFCILLATRSEEEAQALVQAPHAAVARVFNVEPVDPNTHQAHGLNWRGAGDA